MDIVFPEINKIMVELENLKSLIQENKVQLNSQFYNARQCCELKGSMAFNTYKQKPYYQIKGGRPDAKVGGLNVWTRESVLEWLPLTDNDLEEYHRKYKTGAVKK